jgi:hypothetical protein
MRLTSPDGDEGFPGVLHVTATYTLRSANPGPEMKSKKTKGQRDSGGGGIGSSGGGGASSRLVLEMTATVPPSSEGGKPTPVNLAQHSYFNLAGHKASAALVTGASAAASAADAASAAADKEATSSSSSSPKTFSMPVVDGHLVFLNADAFTPVDGDLIPTGELALTTGSVMDLSRDNTRSGGSNSADSSSGGGSGSSTGSGSGGSIIEEAVVLAPHLRAMEAAAVAEAREDGLKKVQQGVDVEIPAEVAADVGRQAQVGRHV